MNVLVLGAAGHIGNAIVRELLSRRGYTISCTGRRTGLPNAMTGLRVKYISGDYNEPGQLEAWITGHQIVIDAAAPYPVAIANQPGASAYEEIDRAMWRTRGLIEAVQRHDATLAYVSSFTTLKQPKNGVRYWPARFAMGLHPYFAIKRMIEDLILDAARSGLRAVIVNPTMCLGPWDSRDRNLTLIPLLLCGEIPGSVNHNLNIVDVREVAAGLVAAIEHKEFGVPMIFSGHNISAQALFRWICEIGGVPAPRLSAPASVTAFGSYLIEQFCAIAGLQQPIRSLAPLLIYQHEWMPPCRAFRGLGISVRPLYETLLDSVDWYRGLGYC